MDDLTKKRLTELSDRAYSRGYNVFSEFLNMEEQSTLSMLRLPCRSFGGYPMAERVVAGFGDDVEDYDFPIVCLCVSPVSSKFADKLSHRDFLGSIMQLGIKRELLGDIVIRDNVGYAFCLEQIADYICDSLTRIKHTTVNVSRCDELPDCVCETPPSSEYIVSSTRADVIISAVFKLSRNEASALFDREKVFVNSRQCVSHSYTVRENDIISVRGFGRIRFLQELKRTKKDRIVIEIIKYS